MTRGPAGWIAPEKDRTLSYSGRDEDCVIQFNSSTTLAKYLDSFGDNPIPVKITVFGDPPTQGAVLKVGNWPWTRLAANEQMVGRQSRPDVVGPIKTCFSRN
jgi:hypothetical protein